MIPRFLLLFLLITGVLHPSVATAAMVQVQNQANTQHLSFDVVEIKRSAPDEQGSFQQTDDSTISRGNTTLWLIELAFGLPEDKYVIGAPPWASKDRYDVTAKVAPEDVSAFSHLNPASRNALLQAALTKYFGLTYVRDVRTFQVLGLFRTTGDTFGPGLTVASPESAVHPSVEYPSRLHLEATGITLDDLCNMVLSTEAQEHTTNRTGLSGPFHVSLKWSRTSLQEGAAADLVQSEPDIFTAVRSQLGLQLKRMNQAAPVVVIRDLSKPNLTD